MRRLEKIFAIISRHKFARISVLTILLSCFLAFLIQTTYASITLRVVAANPSAEMEQIAPIKIYLPVEVKPEHIIYKEDLEVAYDAQQGSYYVSGEYLLKPLEVLEKEIEIEDVWVIKETDILALRQEAKQLFAEFKDTEYSQRAAVLHKGIEIKLMDIEDKQSVA